MAGKIIAAAAALLVAAGVTVGLLMAKRSGQNKEETITNTEE